MLEFHQRLVSLNADAAGTIDPPSRALYFLVTVLALLDAAKANAGHRESSSEEEFLSFCRLAYRKARNGSVKPVDERVLS